MRRHRSLFVVVALLAGASSARAQWIKGADSLPAAAVADSQAALSALKSQITKKPNDAALRFRAGNIAWVLTVRAEANPAPRGLNKPLLRAFADSSLRLAAQLEPKNPTYQLTLARFLRSSSDPVLRVMAPTHVDQALAIARAGTDTSMLLTALYERGRLAWLDYDTGENQIVGCYFLFAPSLDSASSNSTMDTHGNTESGLKDMHHRLIDCSEPKAPIDLLSYDRSEQLFREALAIAPGESRAFRQLAMLLSARNRWTELATLARGRLQQFPSDATAWLALGLALHRSSKWQLASAVFDTAMTKLSAMERARQFSYTQLLPTPDSLAYAAASSTERAERERSFWQAVDPLWSRKGNDPRSEFLARVVFSDLRWTVEEYGVRGADSDRGKVYIRYGPPDRILAVRGCYFTGLCTPPPPDTIGGYALSDMKRPGTLGPAQSDVITYWDYYLGLAFVFWGAPSYGTARIPVPDVGHFERILEIRSAAFDNVASEKLLPMPLSMTRFRAPLDSIDLLVLAKIPMDSIRDIAPNTQVRSDSWLLGRSDNGEYRDSSTIGASGIERMTYRVPPDQYMYRLEATASGSNVAGRATRWITADRDTTTGFTLRGFGVSDLLLATAIEPAKRVPVRWRDFNIAPLLGELPKGQKLELIWENYDIGARSGQTQYSVTITLQRVRTKSGRIAASILGFAAGAVGIDQKDDRVTFKFDRAGPMAPSAFVEHVSLAMGDTPSGEYRMTLEITDKVSGRKATAVSNLVVGAR